MNKIMTISLGILALTVAWYIPVLQAQEPAGAIPEEIGSVASVRGEVAAIGTDGTKRDLAFKSPIYRMDTIKTGERGRVQLTFKDNSVISLGRQTEMTIEQYEYKPEQNQGAMVTNVKEGIFRVMGGAITKIAPGNFKTETPTATIGIRGSFYAGRLVQLRLEVVFLGGRGITVSNKAGFVEITKPSFGTVVNSESEAPEPPRRFNTAELSQLLVSFTSAEAAAEAPVVNSDGDIDNEPPPVVDPPVVEPPPVIPPSIIPPPETDTTPVQPPDPSTTLTLSGRYLGIQVGQQPARSGPDDAVWHGVADGKNTAGSITGEATAQDGKKIAFGFTTVAPDPGGVYTGSYTGTGTHTVSLLGTDRSISVLSLYDNLGEFALFLARDAAFNANSQTFRFSELGYVGQPSLVLPTGGLANYGGPALMAIASTTTGWESVPGTVFTSANFLSHKVLGSFQRSETDLATMYFYGDISGTTLQNVQVLGSYIENSTSTTGGTQYQADGQENAGGFYGSAHQALGMALNGTLSQPDSVARNFYLNTGGLKTEEYAVPTGTITFSGLAIGMETSGGQPRLLGNTDPADFSLTLNRDLGTVSGTMSVYADDNVPELSQVAIGGSMASAYVHDHAFIGELSGSSGTLNRSTITNGMVVTGPPENALADWATWGYWETNYMDSTGANRQVQMPGGYWVAGEVTPASYIRSLMTFGGSLTYTGGAVVSQFNPGQTVPQQYSGNSWFQFFFGDRTFSSKFDFAAANLTMAGAGSLDALGNGFVGAVSEVQRNGISQAPVSSGINGAFYGPQANSVGGTFSADMGSAGPTFDGVFGGNKN